MYGLHLARRKAGWARYRSKGVCKVFVRGLYLAGRARLGGGRRGFLRFLYGLKLAGRKAGWTRCRSKGVFIKVAQLRAID